MQVKCEVSTRHFHPDKEMAEQLLSSVTKKKDLSQKDHWVTNEKFEHFGMQFSMVMPPRESVCFEMSLTDWHKHMDGEPQFSGKFCIKLRHFHCDRKTAEEYGLKEGDKLSLIQTGIRAGRLDNVVVRIDEWSVPVVHLDTDEANALYIKNGDMVELVIPK